MLKIEVIEGADAVNVISDDAYAENVALDDAIMNAAPHLHPDFTAIEINDEGELVWRVERSEYDSLLEVLDAIEGVNPEEVDAALLIVEEEKKEVVE